MRPLGGVEADEAARKGFRRYWFAVKVGVGVVMRGTLRYLKGLAEGRD